MKSISSSAASIRDSHVSVGHRPSVLQYHQHVLELTGASHWRLLPVESYVLETSASAS